MYVYLLLAWAAAIAVAREYAVVAAIVIILSLFALQGYEWNIYINWMARSLEAAPAEPLASLFLDLGEGRENDERVREIEALVDRGMKIDRMFRMTFQQCGVP